MLFLTLSSRQLFTICRTIIDAPNSRSTMRSSATGLSRRRSSLIESFRLHFWRARLSTLCLLNALRPAKALRSWCHRFSNPPLHAINTSLLPIFLPPPSKGMYLPDRDKRLVKDDVVPHVQVRPVVRTPSPSPSEQEALDGPIQLFSLRSLFRRGRPCKFSIHPTRSDAD